LGALSLAFLATSLKIYFYAMQNFPETEAQYAIVLGATTRGPEPTQVFRGRIQRGIELYLQGRVKKIIFTGKPGEPPQAEVGERLALDAGVPKQDILLETQSLITFENLSFAKQLVPATENPTYLIVTDAFHLKRAMLMAKDLQMNASPAPVRDNSFKSHWQQGRFLIRETLAYWKYLVLRAFS